MSSEHFEALIVGAGFGGIGAAIQFKRMGIDDFVILDREDDLGGTWHVNHYPGLAVDGRAIGLPQVYFNPSGEPSLLRPMATSTAITEASNFPLSDYAIV